MSLLNRWFCIWQIASRAIWRCARSFSFTLCLCKRCDYFKKNLAKQLGIFSSLNGIKRTKRQLQADLDILKVWEITWDMQFNPSKCQVIHITRPPSPLPTNYTLHSETLEEVASPRYLGVDIANDPSWKTHISRITNAANKSLGFLRKNLRTQNTSLREMHTRPLSDPIWSMLLQYGTPTLRMTYIKLKEFRDEQPDGSLGIIPPTLASQT